MIWINIWRSIVFTICFFSFSIMAVGYFRHNEKWNKKTRDYWYGRIMWTVTGMVLTFEHTNDNASYNYGLVFITVASLATLKGNLQRGSWGYKKGVDLEK